jgi:hypothetical protein
MCLTATDLCTFARLGISAELLKRASIERVDDRTAREKFGLTGTGDNSGIVFPYFDAAGIRRTCRLRRDNPEMENGKPIKKYLAPYGDRRHPYIVPGDHALGGNASIPVVLVEAEKSALALRAFSDRGGRPLLPIGLGGCWGWRGRIGKVENPKGARVDEIGSLPELALCSNKDVVVMLDSNVAGRSDLRTAQFALVRELEAMGARVRIATVPVLESVNGPDDFIALAGDNAMQEVFESARFSASLAHEEADAAIQGIGAAEQKRESEAINRALDAIANISDVLERKIYESRLAQEVRGQIPKATIVAEVNRRRADFDARQQEIARRNRQTALGAAPVDPLRLIRDLELFFAERAHLPQRAALVLAYFTLNTWTFNVFDTVPYLLLESALPGCGKSTVLRLLNSVACRSRKATSLSEAVMFRLIDAEGPTLLLDEAETLDGRSERSETLRAVAHEGYKKGGQVPRCDGDEHEVRWFNVYGPKVFAAIGGLSGALLDRCIVIHMEKAPIGSVRKTTRLKPLCRDGQRLVAQLEAYAVQFTDALEGLYEAEPDPGYWPLITDRESELWGPLLIHARLAGVEAEMMLLSAVQEFGEAKAEIKACDSKIAQMVALLDAISKHPDDTFTPGDLIAALIDSDAWARPLAEVRGRDDDSVRVNQAAKVGNFLRRFRLRGKKNGSGRMAYERWAAISCLSSHVPQNPPVPPQPPSAILPDIQVAENETSWEGTEVTEALGVRLATSDEEHSGVFQVQAVLTGTKVPGDDQDFREPNLEGEL